MKRYFILNTNLKPLVRFNETKTGVDSIEEFSYGEWTDADNAYKSLIDQAKRFNIVNSIGKEIHKDIVDEIIADYISNENDR